MPRAPSQFPGECLRWPFQVTISGRFWVTAEGKPRRRVAAPLSGRQRRSVSRGSERRLLDSFAQLCCMYFTGMAWAAGTIA
jgi:hypothetical protein